MSYRILQEVMDGSISQNENSGGCGEETAVSGLIKSLVWHSTSYLTSGIT